MTVVSFEDLDISLKARELLEIGTWVINDSSLPDWAGMSVALAQVTMVALGMTSGEAHEYGRSAEPHSICHRAQLLAIKDAAERLLRYGERVRERSL